MDGLILERYTSDQARRILADISTTFCNLSGYDTNDQQILYQAARDRNIRALPYEQLHGNPLTSEEREFAGKFNRIANIYNRALDENRFDLAVKAADLAARLVESAKRHLGLDKEEQELRATEYTLMFK